MSRMRTAPRTDVGRLPAIGLGVAFLLVVASMAIPAVFDWYVNVYHFPPLHGEWEPRLGPGTVPTLVLAVLGALNAQRLAQVLPWRGLLLATFAAGFLWMVSIGLIDGLSGLGHILETDYEYLQTARATDDILATFDVYVSKIRLEAQPNNWPVHIAGHPAGALLFFVVLVRLGLGSALAAGMVVTVLAATTAVAVMVTLRVLGSEEMARRAAPFLVFGPAAITMCVSADAMFAAVGAWGTAALAYGAVHRSWLWSTVAGLLLGYCVMLSYGLPLLGVLSIAVLVAARSFFPLPIAVVAAVAVVLAFAVAGFAWWEAYPAVHDRYWGAVGGRRPAAYWLWGSLAALLFYAGPLLGAGVAVLVGRGRELFREAGTRVTTLLAGAGLTMVLLADLSLMSKAEVERIWLPFVPWLLLSCALLPRRWRTLGLVGQIVAAVVVAHLFKSDW